MTTARLRTPVLGSLGERARGRTLTGYLLLPRPKDLVKALIVPLSFAVGAAARGGVASGALWQAVVVWVVLELLVYQARYQWNDVRGFAADQAHPDAAARGRLPGPVERARPHLAASLGVAVLRLVVTAIVAISVPAVRTVVLAMAVGVFAAAAGYERVRSRATGHTSQVPVTLHPSLIALWVAVGAGYAVRGLTGLALAVALGGRPVLVATAVVTMWALGVVFVTCRWALEALSFASFSDRRVVWDAAAATAREHTLGLVGWLPSSVEAGVSGPPAQWRPLTGRTALSAPWHVALLVAGAASGVTGRLLVGPLRAEVGVVVAAGGLLAALVLTRAVRGRGLVAPALAVTASLLEACAGMPRPLVAVLPLLVVLVAYARFTHQCAAELGRPLRRLEPLLRR